MATGLIGFPDEAQSTVSSKSLVTELISIASPDNIYIECSVLNTLSAANYNAFSYIANLQSINYGKRSNVDLYKHNS